MLGVVHHNTRKASAASPTSDHTMLRHLMSPVMQSLLMCSTAMTVGQEPNRNRVTALAQVTVLTMQLPALHILHRLPAGGL